MTETSLKTPFRVGLYRQDDGVFYFLGFGVKIRNQVPSADALGVGVLLMRATGLAGEAFKLDCGVVVYGCECEWKPEEGVNRMLQGNKVRPMNILEMRNIAAQRCLPVSQKAA